MSLITDCYFSFEVTYSPFKGNVCLANIGVAFPHS